MEQVEWSKLTPEEKKKQLYLQQKNVLDKFLERNAITKAEHDKSLSVLTEKLGIKHW